MSLTLVTGVPGSGKTLYSIEKLLQPLIGATVTRNLEDGTTEEIPRTIYTNINGLQLDHELIDFTGMWSQTGGKWQHVNDPKRPGEFLHKRGIHHWHEWAKPGDFLFLDEFQKAWPPRANGAPVPPDIQALDTHRHMGVDMVLITQNCNNIDRHVLGLVDRHLHIRRFGNMPAAVVYEWDHASRALLYRNAITKKPWRYDKKVFKLYKSAELHTKQARNIPGLVWFMAVGLIAFAILGPTVYARIQDRIHPEQAKKAEPETLIIEDPVQMAQDQAQTAEEPAGDATPAAPAQNASEPVFSGCIAAKTACVCYTNTGLKVEKPPQACPDVMASAPVQLGTVKPQRDYSAGVDITAGIVAASPTSTADGQALAWMRDRQ